MRRRRRIRTAIREPEGGGLQSFSFASHDRRIGLESQVEMFSLRESATQAKCAGAAIARENKRYPQRCSEMRAPLPSLSSLHASQSLKNLPVCVTVQDGILCASCGKSFSRVARALSTEALSGSALVAPPEDAY